MVAESPCQPGRADCLHRPGQPLGGLTQGDLIKTQVAQLIEQPGLGRIGRKRGTRELVISKTPFVVIFRVKAKRIEIIRLLHSSQQYPAS